jgi:futalosine hydrolase
LTGVLSPAHVVEVTEDTFAETGAEDDEQFIPMNILGFGEVTYKPTTTLDEVESSFLFEKGQGYHRKYCSW